MSKRLYYVRNDSGSTTRFFDQVLDNGEEWEIIDRKLDNWRDDLTVSGAITSGTLSVGDGSQFFNPFDGEQYFYEEPTPTTITLPPNSLLAVVSGTNLFGGIDYQFSARSITAQGLTVVSGTEGLVLVADAVVGAAGTTVVSGAGIVTISGGADFGMFEKDGIIYRPDDTRGGKLLSIERASLIFGRQGNTKSVFLGVNGITNSNAGYVLPRPGTITASTSHHTSGVADYHIILDGDIGSPIATNSGISPGPTHKPSQNIDVPSGTLIQIFMNNTGNAFDPTGLIEVAWRCE